MKREYIRPQMEVETIYAGGMLMDSSTPPPFVPSQPAPQRRVPALSNDSVQVF